MTDCQFAGSFCYMCRWNRLRLFSRKSKHPCHFELGNVIPEGEIMGSCTLCGVWMGDKKNANIRKKNLYVGGCDCKRFTSICVNCVIKINKNHDFAIYDGALKNFLTKLKEAD